MAARSQHALLLLVLAVLAISSVHAFLVTPSGRTVVSQRLAPLRMMASGSVRADPLRKGDRVVVVGSSGGCGQLIRCVGWYGRALFC